MLRRHELEEQAPGLRHDGAARDRDGEDEPVVPVVPLAGPAAGEEAAAVDEGAEEDHAAEPDPVGDAARPHRRDDVAARDRREHERGDLRRLVQAAGDVEDDEDPGGGERSLPRGVRGEEAPHVGLLAQDAPARREVGAEAAEDAPVAAVLADEDDHGSAGERRDDGREQERRRGPDVEQESPADERRAERDPPQHVLDALRAAEHPRRQEVGVEAAVRWLVDVVREEEREDDERRRPEVRHEGHQHEAEGHRAEGDEHERAPAAEGRVEGVAPRADHGREQQGEDAFRAEHEGDQRPRAREVAELDRQERQRRDREREPERAQAEHPQESSAGDLRRPRRDELLQAHIGAAAVSPPRPAQTTSTTARSARATSSSLPPRPSTQLVRIVSMPP